MPFEIAPQTEQEQRQALGRIALEAIAAYIVTVRPEAFDMSRWCGTACCAIGHGLALPEVQATGLRLVRDRHGHPVQTHWPKFRDFDVGHDSVAVAFGIPFDVAESLFTDGLGRSREQVAADIRAYLAE